MAPLKLSQVLGATWTFQLTARQAATTPTGIGERQPIAELSDFTAEWRRLGSSALLEADRNGFSIDEDPENPETFGDLTYTKDNDSQSVFAGGGTFTLRLVATSDGEPIALTQGHDIVVQVRA